MSNNLEIDVIIRTGEQRFHALGLSEAEAIEFIQRINYEHEANLDHLTGGCDE